MCGHNTVSKHYTIHLKKTTLINEIPKLIKNILRSLETFLLECEAIVASKEQTKVHLLPVKNCSKSHLLVHRLSHKKNTND